MRIKTILFAGLLAFASIASAGDWVVNSIDGGIFDNVETHKLIIKFGGNTLVISNPNRTVPGEEEIEQSNTADNFNVVNVGGFVLKSQQLGLMRAMRNIFIAADENTVKVFNALADLMTDRVNVIQEVEAIHTTIIAMP